MMVIMVYKSLTDSFDNFSRFFKIIVPLCLRIMQKSFKNSLVGD